VLYFLYSLKFNLMNLENITPIKGSNKKSLQEAR